MNGYQIAGCVLLFVGGLLIGAGVVISLVRNGVRLPW